MCITGVTDMYMCLMHCVVYSRVSRCVCLVLFLCCFFFFFQAEDGIRDAQESRGLGDVYKRQLNAAIWVFFEWFGNAVVFIFWHAKARLQHTQWCNCLLYTSDAADDLLCVDLGGRRIIKKKNKYCNRKAPQHRSQSNKMTKYTAQAVRDILDR